VKSEKRNSMRKLIILISIFAMFGSIFGSEVDELMNQGNQFYQEKNYAGAIEKYNEVTLMGFESTPLYYNLGNAHYRNGQIGYAILNYEKGLKLDPDDENLNYNLKIVKARTVDKIKEVPQLFIVDWWVSLITAFSTTWWSIILLLFYLILLASIAIYLVSRNGKIQRFSFFSGSVGFIGLILAVILLISNVRRETSTDYAILTASTIAAKQSPNESSNDLFVIHVGLKVAVEDQFGEWIEIKLSDGKVGWLPKEALERI